MKEFRGDLIAVGALYTIINLVIWLCLQQYHIKLLKEETLFAKSVAVDLDSKLDNAFQMVNSMNEYATQLETENHELTHSEQILKDIRQSRKTTP